MIRAAKKIRNAFFRPIVANVVFFLSTFYLTKRKQIYINIIFLYMWCIYMPLHVDILKCYTLLLMHANAKAINLRLTYTQHVD